MKTLQTAYEPLPASVLFGPDLPNMKLPPCDHDECGPSACKMKPATEWEGRLHGSQEWEDIWPDGWKTEKPAVEFVDPVTGARQLDLTQLGVLIIHDFAAVANAKGQPRAEQT